MPMQLPLNDKKEEQKISQIIANKQQSKFKTYKTYL